MHEYTCKLENIQVADWCIKSAGEAPHPGSHELICVVDMPSYTPPPRVDQDAGILLPIIGLIVSSYVLGLLPPNFTLAILRADIASLSINVIVCKNAIHTKNKNGA